MKNREFPLFNSHLDLAQDVWKRFCKKDFILVDATCGNGCDSLFLAKHCLQGGSLHCLDIQEKAIESTKEKLKENLDSDVLQKISYHVQSHESFPSEIISADLFIYNLGYLPKEDKTLTTMTSSTLLSVKNALKLLNKGGLISITCYPGHKEGEKEEEALLAFTKGLDKSKYLVCFHTFPNRTLSPSLLLIFFTK